LELRHQAAEAIIERLLFLKPLAMSDRNATAQHDSKDMLTYLGDGSE
jgi:hypothetical protein